jgi:hypothetical protein
MPAWLDNIMSPLNAAGDTLQKLIETRDLIKFGDDLRKLLAEVLAAQRGALTAQANEAMLLERIRELEKEISRFETWEREKARYERRNVGYGAFAYVLKKSERGTEAPHWACTNCYEHGKIVTLQYGRPKRQEKGLDRWFCPSCDNQIEPGKAVIEWPEDD